MKNYAEELLLKGEGVTNTTKPKGKPTAKKGKVKVTKVKVKVESTVKKGKGKKGKYEPVKMFKEWNDLADKKIAEGKEKPKAKVKESPELKKALDILVPTVKKVKKPKVKKSKGLLKEIGRRISAGSKVRLSEDKSREGVIEEVKNGIYNGYSVSFKRPKDYLYVFHDIARTVSMIPEFARSSFGFNDVFLVKDAKEKGRYLLVPIPINEHLKFKRMKAYIRRRPWVYTLGKKKGRIKEPAIKSFKMYLAKSKKLKSRKLVVIKVALHMYRLRVVNVKSATEAMIKSKKFTKKGAC